MDWVMTVSAPFYNKEGSNQKASYIQDCIYTLADIIDKVEDAYKPLEDATISHSQKYPYEPQSGLYTHFNKLTQLTHHVQLRAAKTMVNPRFSWTGPSPKPLSLLENLSNPSIIDNSLGTIITESSLEVGGVCTLAYKQIPTNNISLPQFIRKGTHHILVQENMEDVATKYLLIPPPASPSNEFQVCSEHITSELDVSSPLEAKEAPWYMKMGGLSLEGDKLGVDDERNS